MVWYGMAWDGMGCAEMVWYGMGWDEVRAQRIVRDRVAHRRGTARAAKRISEERRQDPQPYAEQHIVHTQLGRRSGRGHQAHDALARLSWRLAKGLRSTELLWRVFG
jgi:hypothetical protein